MSAEGEEKELNEALLDISSNVPFNSTPDNEDSSDPLKKTPKVVQQKESTTSRTL